MKKMARRTVALLVAVLVASVIFTSFCAYAEETEGTELTGAAAVNQSTEAVTTQNSALLGGE